MDDDTEENSDGFFLTILDRQTNTIGRYFEKSRENFVRDLIDHARYYRPDETEYMRRTKCFL